MLRLPTSFHPGSLRRASLLAITYVTADLALNTQVLGTSGGAMFWPLNGITTALLLTRPKRAWAPLLAIVGLSTVLAEFLSGTDGVSLLMGSIAYLPEVLLAAIVLPPFTDPESWLQTPRLYLRFTIAVLLGPVLAATVYAGGCLTLGKVPFWPTFLDFVPSDMIGLATMIPLVLAIRSINASSLRQWTWWLRVIGVMGATAATMILMFESRAFPLLFVLFPLLIWAEHLAGMLGSALALCCACIAAAGLTAAGHGPFVSAWPSAHIAVQLYLAFHLIAILPISILMTERHFLMRELRAALAHATTLASIDGLTGLSNRRAFDSELRELWQFALRRQLPLGLLMIDADHFKRFNDDFGHQAGDDCLRTLARILKDHASRASDVAARYGGEEFAVLLLDVSLENVRAVGEKIREAVFALSIDHPGASGTGCVTVSIGCASLVPQRDMAANMLIGRADKALYLAKHGGRNQVCCEHLGDESSQRTPAARRLRERIKGFAARGPSGGRQRR